MVRADRHHPQPGRIEPAGDSADAAPIVGDLRRLPPVERAVIVLERFLELPVTQIAYVVGRPIDEVVAVSQQARATLVASHPVRSSDQALRGELLAAVPADIGLPTDATTELGRVVRRHRRRRAARAALAVVAAVLLVVGVVQLTPRNTPVASAPLPTASETPSVTIANCDPANAVCRGQRLIAWRSDMAEIAGSYIDPTGRYFSAVSVADDTRAGTQDFWSADGGALAFRMVRPEGGATEVYLQIATSRATAIRCGKTTGNKCISQRFMDGNRFILTTTTTVKAGMEIQYRPLGNEVITAIAYNVGPGRALKVTSPQLMRLVQDPRLRLPQR